MGADFSVMASACEAAKKSAQFDPTKVELDDAKKLPLEDGIWVIGIVDGAEADDFDPSEAEELGDKVHLRLMSMIDENGKVIGANMKDDRENTSGDQAVDLFKQCMFAPMTWKPRRPRYVGFRNDTYFTELPLSGIGCQKISMFTGALGPDELPEELEQRRACTVCRCRGMPDLFEACSNCDTVYYCTKACMVQDFNHPSDVHGHSEWCAKMKQFSEKADQLADLPFGFIKETTDVNFHDRKLKRFLSKQGVLNQGFWRWEYYEDDMPGFGDLPAEPHPVILPSEDTVLEESPSEPPPLFEGWLDYCKWRKFNLDSPIAVLLQWPLTVYRILTHYAAKQYTKIEAALQSDGVFTIHMIGVEKEADLLPLFFELGHLFPNTMFQIVMIGPAIAQRVDGKEGKGNRVSVKLVKGLYDSYKGPSPNVVIGLNAGLAAYPNWVDTLKKLKDQNIPAYFTDYCQYSCECAKFPMEGLSLGSVTPADINPFRSPIRKYCEEQTMPWYSNGFIFSLIYK